MAECPVVENIEQVDVYHWRFSDDSCHHLSGPWDEGELVGHYEYLVVCYLEIYPTYYRDVMTNCTASIP